MKKLLNFHLPIFLSIALVVTSSFAWLIFHAPIAHAAGASFRSSSVTTYATRTNTVLTAPSGIQDNDILLIFFAIGAASPPAPTKPTGFTLATTTTVTAAGFTVNTFIWWKVASSESGNYTVTHASASSQGYIEAISGANTSNPINPIPKSNKGTGATSTGLGLTTVTNNSLVLFLEHDWGDTTNNLTAPTGSTPTFTKEAGPSTAPGIIFVADGQLATAGATGNKTMTNNSSVGNPWVTVMLSIAAAPALDVFNAGSSCSNGCNTLTWTHTITAGVTNGLIAVVVNYCSSSDTSPTVSTVSWGSVNLSQRIAETISNTECIEIWDAPTGSTTGAQTVTVTFGGTRAATTGQWASSYSLTGINQTTPADATGNTHQGSGTTQTASVTTTVTGDFILDAITINSSNALTKDASQTLGQTHSCCTSGTANGGTSYKTALSGAPGSVTSTWTTSIFTNTWSQVVVAYQSPSSSAPVSIPAQSSVKLLNASVRIQNKVIIQ